MNLEHILKDRVETLIVRAKSVRKSDKALSNFLLREAKLLCEYHDLGNLFITMEEKK